MISVGNRVQLEMVIDTCGQGKDITNTQTRGMLTMLAMCMLNRSTNSNSQEILNSSLSQSNKCMEMVSNLEERIHEKNCELHQ